MTTEKIAALPAQLTIQNATTDDDAVSNAQPSGTGLGHWDEGGAEQESIDMQRTDAKSEESSADSIERLKLKVVGQQLLQNPAYKAREQKPEEFNTAVAHGLDPRDAAKAANKELKRLEQQRTGAAIRDTANAARENASALVDNARTVVNNANVLNTLLFDRRPAIRLACFGIATILGAGFGATAAGATVSALGYSPARAVLTTGISAGACAAAGCGGVLVFEIVKRLGQ
jgi:hypothetical protein